MMRLNHEFWCSVALLPGLRNGVEMIRNMQQEGVGLVLLPHPASLIRAPVLPCAEAPWGECGVLLADAGVRNQRCRWSSCAGRGWKGLGWQLVLCDLFVSAELMTIRKHWLDEG